MRAFVPMDAHARTCVFVCVAFVRIDAADVCRFEIRLVFRFESFLSFRRQVLQSLQKLVISHDVFELIKAKTITDYHNRKFQAPYAPCMSGRALT